VTFFITRPPDLIASPAVDETDAEQVIAGGTGGDATRAGDIGGKDAADGRLAAGAHDAAVIHRLEGKHLPIAGKCCLDFAHRRSRLGAHRHFGRIVADDAGEFSRREHLLCLDAVSKARTRTAAGDRKRHSVCSSLPDDIGGFRF
jgi:hypothetical protein